MIHSAYRTSSALPAVLRLAAVAAAGVVAISGWARPEEQPSAAGQPPASAPKPSKEEVWSLFDGETLIGWTKTDFAGSGDVEVKDGKILLGMGYMTGITWTNKFPKMNYEVSLEAMRVEGSDFFCGLTFPVGDDP